MKKNDFIFVLATVICIIEWRTISENFFFLCGIFLINTGTSGAQYQLEFRPSLGLEHFNLIFTHRCLRTIEKFSCSILNTNQKLNSGMNGNEERKNEVLCPFKIEKLGFITFLPSWNIGLVTTRVNKHLFYRLTWMLYMH